MVLLTLARIENSRIAGAANAARMERMAMETMSSIRVKPRCAFLRSRATRLENGNMGAGSPLRVPAANLASVLVGRKPDRA
ncbi:MAG: hypothetical protein AMXMBFR25_06550 [Lysobacterales bacterium]